MYKEEGPDLDSGRLASLVLDGEGVILVDKVRVFFQNP